MSAYKNCTAVSPACPVDATTYGYAPNLGGNAVLLTVFVICLIAQVGLGVWSRAWTFLIALAGGCLIEFIGYIGRIQMYHNVWGDGFRTQVVCLIVAPSFIAAGVYLSLKHIILHLGPEASWLKPKYYTWIFISFDITSFLMQAAGGGIAAAAGENPDTQKVGNDMMVAGVAIQVVTMIICGLLALDFAWRYSRRQPSPQDNLSISKSAGFAAQDKKFKIFCYVEIFAYVTVLIRCIYRLPEMAGGWGNELMRKEADFMILDGMMIALAVIALTVFHPAIYFPRMTGRPHGLRGAAEPRPTDMEKPHAPLEPEPTQI